MFALFWPAWRRVALSFTYFYCLAHGGTIKRYTSYWLNGLFVFFSFFLMRSSTNMCRRPKKSRHRVLSFFFLSFSFFLSLRLVMDEWRPFYSASLVDVSTISSRRLHFYFLKMLLLQWFRFLFFYGCSGSASDSKRVDALNWWPSVELSEKDAAQMRVNTTTRHEPKKKQNKQTTTTNTDERKSNQRNNHKRRKISKQITRIHAFRTDAGRRCDGERPDCAPLVIALSSV